MTIFGVILAENEWKMTDFSLKTKTFFGFPSGAVFLRECNIKFNRKLLSVGWQAHRGDKSQAGDAPSRLQTSP